MSPIPDHLQAIYETLRERICLLRYPPGMRLRETELAEEFGVSRTPLRQVLQRLQFEGLLEARNGVGTLVTGIELAGFHDIYAMRLRVAELIGPMSAGPVSEGAVAQAEALQTRAEQLRLGRDLSAFWGINHELHHLVANLIGNAALRELWHRYYYQTARIWYGSIEDTWGAELDSLCAELGELARFLRTGDLHAVGLVQRNYIALGYARVRARYGEATG